MTPAGNQFGTANLTIQVNDGNGGTDSEVLVLTVTSVNDLPIMNPISPVTIAEDGTAGGADNNLTATDIETAVGSLAFSVTTNSNPTLIPSGWHCNHREPNYIDPGGESVWVSQCHHPG